VEDVKFGGCINVSGGGVLAPKHETLLANAKKLRGNWDDWKK
jgi:hypothetical protein